MTNNPEPNAVHSWVFRTQRLQCRPLVPEDEKHYLALYQDTTIMRHIGTPMVADKAIKSFRKLLNQNDQSGQFPLIWMILSRENDEVYGIQSLHLNPTEGNAEAGIMLFSDVFNKGVATEAISGLLRFGFQHLNLVQVYAHFTEQNIGVYKFVKKIGFDVTQGDRQGYLTCTITPSMMTPSVE